MIEVNNLSFEYPGTRALDSVTFSLNAGDIVALVGPNGAGKTTLLRCLAGLAEPVEGTISIDGIDVLEQPRAAHRRIGYLPDFFGLYDSLTLRQCLNYMAGAHNIAEEQVNAAVERAARRLNIDDRLEQKVAALSRGLRQRLAIAQAIIHEPPVLLLDEPASGLDPEARHSLSALFLELQQQGMTLVVSSHILSELEEYCSDMIIVRHGRIHRHEALVHEDEKVVLQVKLSTDVSELQSQLEKIENIDDIVIDAQGRVVTFRYSQDASSQQQLLKQLVESGLPLCSFHQLKQNMQDAYMQHIERIDQGEKQ